MTHHLTRKPIVVFCGKGGVGKTTLSLSCGLGHARAGKRVVIVSSHPVAELAVAVSLEGLSDVDPEAAANLFVVHIEPRQILSKMFQGQFPSQILARTVLSSKIYKSLIEVAPGLKEIAFLARLRELAEQRSQVNGLPFDLLIWDAPATGHFLETLRVSRKFETYLSGPFADTGKELQHFFSERADLLIFPVTTLEEMAVQETIELCAKLKHDLALSPAGIVCNLVSPMLSLSEKAKDDSARLPGLSARSMADLAFVLDRHRIEREEFEKLRASLRRPFYFVRRVASWESDLELLQSLSAQMQEIDLGLK